MTVITSQTLPLDDIYLWHWECPSCPWKA